MTWWDTLIQFIQHLDGNLKILLGVLATIVILGKKAKNGWTKAKGFAKKADNAMDTLNGRPPVLHPDTGAVLAEATLPLAQRINAIEVNQSEMNSAIKLLAENQTRMMKVEDTLAEVQAKLEERDSVGMQIIEEWTAWREEFSGEKITEHQKIWDAIERLDKTP